MTVKPRKSWKERELKDIELPMLPARPCEAELRYQVMRDRERLADMVDKLLEMACNGNLNAMKMVFDRLDGGIILQVVQNQEERMLGNVERVLTQDEVTERLRMITVGKTETGEN